MNRWTKSSWLCDSLGQLLLQICIKKKKKKKSECSSATSVLFQGIKYPTTSLWGKPCIAKKIKKMFFSHVAVSFLSELLQQPSGSLQGLEHCFAVLGEPNRGGCHQFSGEAEYEPRGALWPCYRTPGRKMPWQCTSVMAQVVLPLCCLQGALQTSQQFLTSFECKVLHKL